MSFSNVAIQITDTQRASQWMDLQGANDWLARSVTQAAANPGTSYADQLSATTGLFRNIGQFYKNVNVHPQSDPIYAKWWQDWFGSATPLDLTQAAWSADNGVGLAVAALASTRMVDPNSTMGRRFLAMWQALHKPTIVPGDLNACNLIIRLELDQNGDVLQQCTSGRQGSDLCDFSVGTLNIGCAQDGATTEGCDTYDWNTLMWNDPLVLPGRAGATCLVQRILPPLKWFHEAAADLVTRISNRSDSAGAGVPRATVAASAIYTILWNLKLAAKYHLQLPAALQVIAANLPDNRQLAQLQAQQQNLAATQGMQALASATGNPYAQLFVTLVQLFMLGAPAATGVEVDIFGRPLPFLMKVTIQDAPAGFVIPGAAQRIAGVGANVAHNLGIQPIQPPIQNITPPLSTAAKVGIGLGVVGALFVGWKVMSK